MSICLNERILCLSHASSVHKGRGGESTCPLHSNYSMPRAEFEPATC